MICVAVSGAKKTGKSTLCRALMERVRAAGLAVGYIKRTSEEIESCGANDTGRARAMGVPTLLWGPNGVVYEDASDAGADPRALAEAFFPSADVVVLEGGKEIAMPKIWALAEGEETSPHRGAFAFYSMHGAREGVHGPDDVDALAQMVIEMASRDVCGATLAVDGCIVPMKDFVSDFIEGGVRGMAQSLKRAEGASDGEVRLHIRSRRSRRP